MIKTDLIKSLKTLVLQRLLFFIFSFLFLNSCDQTFNPLQENEKYYFSIYGYLDAAADTQWVRVGPTRQNINESPDPSGIIVSLEHVQSGETVVMNDSLFSSKNFLNYWTTMDIENAQTYRITAERDGKISRATITTPKEILSPYILPIERPRGYNVYIDDSVEHIADVQSVWYIILNPETEAVRRTYTFGIRHTLKYTTAFSQSYFAFANHEIELSHIEQAIGRNEYSIEKRQFFIAAGGPEWDENILTIDDLEYFLDGTASNVENGLGYVVGIDSKWVEQETCLNPEESAFAPCTPDDGPFWYHD